MSFRHLIAYATTLAGLSWSATSAAQGDGTVPTIVVATDGATDAAWPLATAVYRDARTRPSALTDPSARVLAGESAPDGDAPLRELSELRAAVRGDDEASRQVLSALADRLRAKDIIVVFVGAPPVARLFHSSTRRFEAARYAPDERSLSSMGLTWNDALDAIHAVAGADTALASSITRPPPPTQPTKSKVFYESPWFWVAVGVATLAGGGVLIATNVQTSDAVRLQARLP